MSRQPHLVLLTDGQWQGNAELKSEDIAIIGLLKEAGIRASVQNWKGDDSSWLRGCTHLLTKSPWNYHLTPGDFIEFLRAAENRGIEIINPLAAITFNIDKSYLLAIAEKHPVIPAAVLDHRTPLADYFKRWQCEQLVVKPAISAGSYQTYLLDKDRNNNTLLRGLACSQQKFLVQPFWPEIQQGEYSLIYLNRKLSHAVLKIPPDEEFRSQPEFGGRVEHLESVPAEIADQAAAIINDLARHCFYARVDGLIRENQFHLMELELIEPWLYMKPRHVEQYCSQLMVYLKNTPQNQHE